MISARLLGIVPVFALAVGACSTSGGDSSQRSLAQLDSAVHVLEQGQGQWVLYRKRILTGVSFGSPPLSEPLDAFPTREACRLDAAQRVSRSPAPPSTQGTEEFAVLESQGGSYSFFNLRCLPKGMTP